MKRVLLEIAKWAALFVISLAGGAVLGAVIGLGFWPLLDLFQLTQGCR